MSGLRQSFEKDDESVVHSDFDVPMGRAVGRDAVEVAPSVSLGQVDVVMSEEDTQTELAGRPDIGTPWESPTFSHLDSMGHLQMVDVSTKLETERRAVAVGRVRMRPSTISLIAAGKVAKGSVLAVAQVAGMMAAKRCSELIPLAHPLLLTHIEVNLELDVDSVRIEASVRTTWKTGVEMEALTAVTMAALTVYDMCKAVDRSMIIDGVEIVSKTGGRTDLLIQRTSHDAESEGGARENVAK